MGLLQGSVLSPIRFVVVMACAIPSIIRDPLLGMGTSYADDVYIWSTGASVPVIIVNLHTSLDKVIKGLR